MNWLLYTIFAPFITGFFIVTLVEGIATFAFDPAYVIHWALIGTLQTFATQFPTYGSGTYYSVQITERMLLCAADTLDLIADANAVVHLVCYLMVFSICMVFLRLGIWIYHQIWGSS